MLKFNNGPLKITGNLSVGKPAFVLPLDNAAICAPSTDFNNALFDVTLSPLDITVAGTYALVFSPVPLTRYIGTNTPTWVGGSSPLTVTRVTPAGQGDLCRINGSFYWCLTVTVA